jgi:hypothetical protein
MLKVKLDSYKKYTCKIDAADIYSLSIKYYVLLNAVSEVTFKC